MRATVKRMLLLALGWGFILLGIAGLFLPVLQGVLFLLIGLVILSCEYCWAHRLLERLQRHFPRLHKVMHHARARADALLGRQPPA
jgi:uncharacterized membrane protein YbaN (DUF454 family)